jgi:hypothetical protein
MDTPVSSSTNFTPLPPIIPQTSAAPAAAPPAPDSGTSGPQSAGAISGLSGGIPITRPEPTAPEPPHESVSRHILSALSGGNDPMLWAKSVLAGGLAAAANVGKVPEGSGWLGGAERGAAGVQELQRQKMLDEKAAQQQQFENQEKLKADARAQQELEEQMKSGAAQRAMWTAQTAAAVQMQQQNAARFPMLQREDQDRVRQLEDQIHVSEEEQLSVLSSAGVDITKLEHITSTAQLTSDHAKQAGAGTLFPIQNGEEHKAGEDGAGVYLVPGDVWERTIQQPIEITTGYDVDPKTGKATPRKITAQAGTQVGILLAVAKGAQTDLLNKQNQIYKQAQLAQAQAQTREAGAAAAKSEEETRQLKEWDLGKKEDGFGNLIGAPGMNRQEYVKRVDEYNKDYSKDLNQLDQARAQLSGIIQNAEETGKLPGADAVVGIFDAIGLSSAPLKGRGFRINQQIIGEHVTGTRNAWQGMALRLARLTPTGTGQIVQLQQLKDYERIMDQARHDAYIGAANDAVNRGIGVQLVPRGNGAPADGNTIDIFLTMAKGNPQLAAEMLKKYGWEAPRAQQ